MQIFSCLWIRVLPDFCCIGFHINTDYTWHQLSDITQVLILCERLHSVTTQFDQLRAIRFQDAVNRVMPRRKLHKVANSNSSDTSKSDLSDLRGQELPSEPLRVQEQLLDDETRALQVTPLIYIAELIVQRVTAVDHFMHIAVSIACELHQSTWWLGEVDSAHQGVKLMHP